MKEMTMVLQIITVMIIRVASFIITMISGVILSFIESLMSCLTKDPFPAICHSSVKTCVPGRRNGPYLTITKWLPCPNRYLLLHYFIPPPPRYGVLVVIPNSIRIPIHHHHLRHPSFCLIH